VNTLLSDLDHPLDQGERDEAISDLATLLGLLSGQARPENRIDMKSVKQAKLFIDERIINGFTLSELEREIGQDRWKLSRDFRSALGTSPYRYLIMRRLDRARRLLLSGHGIADTAHACSFSDQSHFNRHFKKCNGVSPKAWLVSMGGA